MPETPVSGASSDEVVREDGRRREAILATDLAALDRLLADELIYIHGSGKLDTKERYLAAVGSRKTIYKSIEYQDPVLRNLSENATLMLGKIIMEVESDGVPRSIKNHFCAIWLHSARGWQLGYWQSTSLPREN